MFVLLTEEHPLEISNCGISLGVISGGEKYVLDTIKVAIPLSRAQHRRIHKIASDSDAYTWALVHQATMEVVPKKFQSMVETDGESYHREIRFSYPPQWTHDAKLWLEFSVPKFWYGHNIIMLYNWPKTLNHFRERLVTQFELRRSRFPKIEDWEVYRADACYAYKLPSQQLAQMVLDGLKRQRFPKKKPTIYPDAIFFGGGTFAFKVYLKRPEFFKHDRKALLKQEVALEWVEHLENLSDGVLRVEASMRRQYLVNHGIKTVGDLMEDRPWMEWDDHFSKIPGFDQQLSTIAIMTNVLAKDGKVEITPESLTDGTALVNGCYYQSPDMCLDLGHICYYHPAGGFTYHRLPVLLDTLRTLLHRFLGGVQGMMTVDKVEAVLLEHYKPAIATKLVGFWLYVKQFGADKAKEACGRDSYYYQKRQLKQAGVPLMEAHENVVKVDVEFFRNWRLDIPSEYAHHKTDEFRDHGNVLNLDTYRHNAG
jgi:hypothetical protein